MKLIGITGGVGSGKSELLRYIEKHYNSIVIRSDEAVHDLELPGGAIYEPLLALLEQYGGPDGVLLADGTIARAEMAARIFAHKELLAKVNALIHPAVKVFIMDEVERARREKRCDFFFVEAALLIECGYGDLVDEMWYIFCSQDVRRERLRASRGYSDEKITAIMKSQLDEETFRANADVVIDNSGTLEESCRQIDRILTRE